MFLPEPVGPEPSNFEAAVGRVKTRLFLPLAVAATAFVVASTWTQPFTQLVSVAVEGDLGAYFEATQKATAAAVPLSCPCSRAQPVLADFASFAAPSAVLNYSTNVCGSLLSLIDVQQAGSGDSGSGSGKNGMAHDPAGYCRSRFGAAGTRTAACTSCVTAFANGSVPWPSPAFSTAADAFFSTFPSLATTCEVLMTSQVQVVAAMHETTLPSTLLAPGELDTYLVGALSPLAAQLAGPSTAVFNSWSMTSMTMGSTLAPTFGYGATNISAPNVTDDDLCGLNGWTSPEFVPAFDTVSACGGCDGKPMAWPWPAGMPGSPPAFPLPRMWDCSFSESIGQLPTPLFHSNFSSMFARLGFTPQSCPAFLDADVWDASLAGVATRNLDGKPTPALGTLEGTLRLAMTQWAAHWPLAPGAPRASVLPFEFADYFAACAPSACTFVQVVDVRHGGLSFSAVYLLAALTATTLGSMLGGVRFGVNAAVGALVRTRAGRRCAGGKADGDDGVDSGAAAASTVKPGAHAYVQMRDDPAAPVHGRDAGSVNASRPPLPVVRPSEDRHGNKGSARPPHTIGALPLLPPAAGNVTMASGYSVASRIRLGSGDSVDSDA